MMWELIRSNKRKSFILFCLMGFCLVLLGFFIGSALGSQETGLFGLFVALFLWIIMSIVSYSSGDSIILSISKAKKVTQEVHPQLYHVVEEMKIAAGLPHMPEVYIIGDPAPNAFATGIRPEKSAIVVTAGLLTKLNRDELQGVVAHEMSHIMNRDVLFMTFASMLLGSVVLISQVFLRSLYYSSGPSRRYRSSSSSKSGGQIQLIFVAVAILFAILSPILVRLLYFAVSRRREYLADASAVRLTRYPEGLASALEKIANNHLDLASANKVTAPLYIINPLKKKGQKLSNLTNTHPPIRERIQILRNISTGAHLLAYQKSFSQVKGKFIPIIPHSGLRDKAEIPLRKIQVKEETPPSRHRTYRDLGDLIRATEAYTFLLCGCGLKIKIPPEFQKDKIRCPRCGAVNPISMTTLSTLGVKA